METQGGCFVWIVEKGRRAIIRGLIILGVSVGVYWALKLIFGDRTKSINEEPNVGLGLAAIGAFFGLAFLIPVFGTKVPGSVFERSDYEGMFEVRLYPEGNYSRSQKVAARIVASMDSETDGDGRSMGFQYYRIAFAQVPGRGRVSFVDQESSLMLGEIVRVADEAGKSWGVELTDQPIRSKK